MGLQNPNDLILQTLRENADTSSRGEICSRWFSTTYFSHWEKKRATSGWELRIRGGCTFNTSRESPGNMAHSLFIQIKLQDSSVSFVDPSFSQHAFSAHKLEKGVRGFIQEAETTQSLTLSKFQDMWEDHSHQTSEQISAWLLHWWDNRAAVSTWRVGKSKSWDPSLETRELREWNRVSNLQSLEMVPLKC